MPRFTASAVSRRCMWQEFRSLHVFRIPITGFPTISSLPHPACFARERCPKDLSSSLPYQRQDRSCSGVLRVGVFSEAIGKGITRFPAINRPDFTRSNQSRSFPLSHQTPHILVPCIQWIPWLKNSAPSASPLICGKTARPHRPRSLSSDSAQTPSDIPLALSP